MSQNTILVSYEGPESAQCRFIFCSFTPREFTVSSLVKTLVISVSQRQGVNGSANWKCIEIASPTITTLFCIILILVRPYQPDLFRSLGVRAHPAHPPPPPAYEPA